MKYQKNIILEKDWHLQGKSLPMAKICHPVAKSSHPVAKVVTWWRKVITQWQKFVTQWQKFPSVVKIRRPLAKIHMVKSVLTELLYSPDTHIHLGPNLKGGVQIDLLNDYPSKQSNLIHLEYSFRSHLIQESLSVD